MPDHSTNNDLKGIGPNFWMYGVESDTTLDWSEIDDFEFAGKYGNDYNVMTTNAHYRKCDPAYYPNSVSTGPSDTIHRAYYRTYPQSISFNNQFHILSFNWTPEKIDFYFDGSKYETLDSLDAQFQTATSKFTKMPLIIDVNFPTIAFGTYQDAANTVFPHTYEIDYVRVWQYKQYCDSTLNICNFNAATYDPAVYKQVNVGGSGCNAAISGGQNVSFVGEEHVLLGEGFSVDANSTFLGDVKNCTDYFENARVGPPAISPKPAPVSFNKNKAKN
jgi:beta-glucanase (GH16 family)